MVDKRVFTPKRVTTKSEYVRDFIVKYAAQANPIADKHGVNTSGELVKELPFRSLEDFYKEFQSIKSSEGLSSDKIPGRTTFQNVMLDKKKQLGYELRYLRCKGSHATCEVCSKAAILLDDKHKVLDKEGKINEYIVVVVAD